MKVQGLRHCGENFLGLDRLSMRGAQAGRKRDDGT